MYKKVFQNKKAALFDLDGTIIDSLPYWRTALRLVLEDASDGTASLHGVDSGSYLGEIWKSTIKKGGLKTELSVEELVKKSQQEYLYLFNENPLEPRDGFWVFIDALKNDKNWVLALISNSDNSVVEPVLKSLNINEGVFDAIITGDKVKHRKPSPDIYNKVLKELKLKSKDALAFEDSLSGARASGKAGIDTVVILNGETPEPEYPDNVLLFLSDFSTLPGNLDVTYLEASKKRLDYMQSELA